MICGYKRQAISGWILWYQCVHGCATANCGGVLTASSSEQTITSPGYQSPGYYNSQLKCAWKIQVCRRQRLTALVSSSFLDFFLATCTRLSWSLNFWVHVKLFYRIVSCSIQLSFRVVCFPNGKETLFITDNAIAVRRITFKLKLSNRINVEGL